MNDFDRRFRRHQWFVAALIVLVIGMMVVYTAAIGVAIYKASDAVVGLGTEGVGQEVGKFFKGLDKGRQ